MNSIGVFLREKCVRVVLGNHHLSLNLSIKMLLLGIFLLSTLPAFAQQIVATSSTWTSASTLSISTSEPTDSIGPGEHISIQITFEKGLIDWEASLVELDMGDSWFADQESDFEYELIVDPVVETVSITMYRTNGSTFGSGELATIGGLVILLDVPQRLANKMMVHAIVEITDPKFDCSINPNPIEGHAPIHIVFSNFNMNRLNLTIISSNGEMVRIWELMPEGKEVTLNQDLPPGKYWLRVGNGESAVTKPFIIQ